MSDGFRAAIAVGIAIAVVHLILRQVRSGGIQFPDFLEAVGLAATPLVVPGAVEMIIEAFGTETLPIFNKAEDRVALILGGAILIGAVAYGDLVALHRAWKGKRA
jgi:hypothetical protein